MSGTLTATAVLLDFYNTLVDISTDESDEEVWEQLASFMRYSGIQVQANTLHEEFVTAARHVQQSSSEAHPEIDVLGIFRSLLAERSAEPVDVLAAGVVRLFRSLSIRRFVLFPDTVPALRCLRARFQLGLVTNAQPLFVRPEIEMVGLGHFFDVIVVSGDHGFAKPDTRLFQIGLDALQINPDQAVFVGDDASLDICGAKQANLRAVLLDRHGAFQQGHPTCPPDAVIHELVELGQLLVPITV